MSLFNSFVEETATIEEAMRIIDKTEKKTIFVVRDKNILSGVVNDGDVRRALLNGVDKEESILKITNRNPITDVEIAKKRVNDTDTQYLLVPIVDNENRIVDCTVVTKNGQVSFEDNVPSTKRILVIGGAGYLGSILCKKLLEKGYHVRVLDSLIYGDEGLRDLYKYTNFEFIFGDVRNLQKLVQSIRDVTAVIHLAAIVGDPASALKPSDTIENNYFVSKMVAEVCKFSQINRLIFASTCSVYGASEHDSLLNEKSKLNPVSLYAKMKLKSEKGILEMIDENFKPTIFRMATLHGTSDRMRFDLAVNIMTIKAIYEGKISVHGGEQQRAFCHVDDAAEAYIKCLETPLEKVGGQIFNIVSQNLSIGNLAKIIKGHILEAEIEVQEITDLRDYIVSGSWADTTMGLKHSSFVEKTITDIMNNKEKFEDYNDKRYSNVDYLKET